MVCLINDQNTYLSFGQITKSAKNYQKYEMLPAVISTDSPTNLRNLVEMGSHFHMANSASLPVPIPKRIARTKAFVWASHVRPIPP